MVNFNRGIGMIIFLIPFLITLGSCGKDPFLYVTNDFHGTVSVFDTATNQQVTSIMAPDSICPKGRSFCLLGVALSPDGSNAYVTNQNYSNPGSVFVIDTAFNTPLSGLSYPVGVAPAGLAVAKDGKVYVANSGDGTVSVIDTAANSVSKPIKVGTHPGAVAVAATPKGVTKVSDGDVRVIDTSTNSVATISVDGTSNGFVVYKDRVYVATEHCDTWRACLGSLSAFDTTSNLSVPGFPISLGTITPSGISSGPYYIAVLYSRHTGRQ